MTALQKVDTTSQTLFENLPDLMTIEEVATYLREVEPKTIRKWIGLGVFPYIRIGRANMVRKSSLAVWMKEQESTPWLYRR